MTTRELLLTNFVKLVEDQQPATLRELCLIRAIANTIEEREVKLIEDLAFSINSQIGVK